MIVKKHLSLVLILVFSTCWQFALAQEEVKTIDSLHLKLPTVLEDTVRRNADVEEKAAALIEQEFGIVALDDLYMTVLESDSAAPAYVLYDNGFMKFDRGRGQFFMEYHAQVKILNQEGFDYADVSLPFAVKKGLVDVKAMTHNLVDGKVQSTVVAESDMIVDEVMEKYYVQKITFPDVVVGSIIEYSYKMYGNSPFEFLPWYFQSTIPVRYSRFRVSGPQTRNLKPRVYGYQGVYHYDNSIFGPSHDIVMKDLPTFREEPYVKKIDDHYSKVAFEYVSTFAVDWESLNDLIFELRGFGVTIEKLLGIRKTYPKNMGWQADAQSLQDIHSYVAKHFEWNGDYGLMFSDKPKKVWDTATGSAADINLTLLMFLRRAGFEADPVFVSTTKHGLINTHIPTFGQFNNLVVRVKLNGKETLLDATSELRPFNILPDECLNDSGLVVKQGEVEWVAMNVNKEREIQSLSISFEVDEFGEMEGTGIILSSGSTGADLRIDIDERKESQGTQKPQFMEDVNNLDIDDVTFEGLENPYTSLKTNFTFTSDDRVESIGNRLFFSPIVFPEAESNPFKAETRTLAVEFSKPISRRYFFRVKIPEGYEVEEMPEQGRYVLPGGGGEYNYILQATETDIQVLVRFRVNRILFMPEEYQGIRELFNLIIAKQEEKIVLKKL